MKNWIKGAVNPAHKGYCTPMTKSTCTPRRKAFAMRAKRHFKYEDGGEIPTTNIASRSSVEVKKPIIEQINPSSITNKKNFETKYKTGWKESTNFITNWYNNPTTQNKLKEHGYANPQEINKKFLNSKTFNNYKDWYDFRNNEIRRKYYNSNYDFYRDLDNTLYNEYIDLKQNTSGFYSPVSHSISTNEDYKNKRNVVNIQIHEGIHATGLDDFYAKKFLNLPSGYFKEKPFEIYPRIMEIRKALNLVPGQKVTIDMLKGYKNSSENLEDYFSPEDIVKMLNELASNKTNSSSNIMQHGGIISNPSDNTRVAKPYIETNVSTKYPKNILAKKYPHTPTGKEVFNEHFLPTILGGFQSVGLGKLPIKSTLAPMKTRTVRPYGVGEIGTPADLKNLSKNKIVSSMQDPKWKHTGDPMDHMPTRIWEGKYNWDSKFPSTDGFDRLTGRTDVPDFNSKINQFKTELTFGKQPLIKSRVKVNSNLSKTLGRLKKDYINTTDFAVGESVSGETLKKYLKDQFPDKYKGINALQDIKPNAYGGTINKKSMKTKLRFASIPKKAYGGTTYYDYRPKKAYQSEIDKYNEQIAAEQRTTKFIEDLTNYGGSVAASTGNIWGIAGAASHYGGETLQNAINPKDEYGVAKSDINVVATEQLSPTNTVIGGVPKLFQKGKFWKGALDIALPFVGAGVDNRDRRNLRDKYLRSKKVLEDRERSEAALVNYPTFGNMDTTYYKYGGKCKANGGVISLPAGAKKFVGDSHEEGGIPITSDNQTVAEVEGGEVMFGNKIYSDRLPYKGGKTIADEAEKRAMLGDKKGLKKLFTFQEKFKKATGIENPPGKAYFGRDGFKYLNSTSNSSNSSKGIYNDFGDYAATAAPYMNVAINESINKARPKPKMERFDVAPNLITNYDISAPLANINRNLLANYRINSMNTSSSNIARGANLAAQSEMINKANELYSTKINQEVGLKNAAAISRANVTNTNLAKMDKYDEAVRGHIVQKQNQTSKNMSDLTTTIANQNAERNQMQLDQERIKYNAQAQSYNGSVSFRTMSTSPEFEKIVSENPDYWKEVAGRDQAGVDEWNRKYPNDKITVGWKRK